MVKKAQMVIEFLLTYGWSIIILLGIIITFSSLYVFKIPPCPTEFQIAGDGFTLLGQKFMGSDSEVNESQNLFYIILKNTPLSMVTIKNITILKNGVECGNFKFPNGYTLGSGQVTNVLQEKLDNSNPDCVGKVNSCYEFDVKIKYSGGIAGLLDKVSDGTLSGKFQNLGDKWILGEFVFDNSTGNEIMKNRGGEKLNVCAPEAPQISPIWQGGTPAGIITWDLPNGCSSGQVGQKGFANVCGSEFNVTNLAKGWLHATLYVDSIFSNSEVYLGGNAVYYDVNASEPKTNGICMNDNLYFYVNGLLKYYGGTTGKMIGNASTYQTGDEVLKNCGNCESVDSSKWCIPAFELTTAGFNFGQQNNIDILVEDFCKGGGQAHAGGMSELSIRLV